MGGESQLLELSETLELRQSFKDHQKQATCGRFSADGRHFVTISRDHSAKVYVQRGDDYALAGSWSASSEVTACCWLGSELVLAAREDHELPLGGFRRVSGLKVARTQTFRRGFDRFRAFPMTFEPLFWLALASEALLRAA